MEEQTVVDTTLVDRIRETILSLEPGAEIILYGSRARGEAGHDSDWDVVALVDGTVDAARQDRLHDALYDLGLDTDQVVTCLVYERAAWNSPVYRAMPLRQAVDKDGMRV